MFYTFRAALILTFIESRSGEEIKQNKVHQPQDPAQPQVHITATSSSAAADVDDLLLDDDGGPHPSYALHDWQADILTYSNHSTPSSSVSYRMKRCFTTLKLRVFNAIKYLSTTSIPIFHYTSQEQSTVTRDLQTVLRAMRYNSYGEVFFLRGWFRYMLFEYVIPTCMLSVAQYVIGWGSLTVLIAIVPAVVSRLIWVGSCMMPLTLHTL